MSQPTNNVNGQEIKQTILSKSSILNDLFTFSVQTKGQDIYLQIRRTDQDQTLDIEISDLPTVLWHLQKFCFPNPALLYPQKEGWLTPNYEEICGLTTKASLVKEEDDDIIDDIKEGVGNILDSVGEIVDDIKDSAEQLIEFVIGGE